MKATIAVICLLPIVLVKSALAQVAWQFDKGPYFARIHDFAVGVKNGSTILYAADSSENSLLKSTDRGESWIHVLGGPGVRTHVKCVATVRNTPDEVGVLIIGSLSATRTPRRIENVRGSRSSRLFS